MGRLFDSAPMGSHVEFVLGYDADLSAFPFDLQAKTVEQALYRRLR